MAQTILREKVHRFLSEGLTIRAASVIATRAVDEMRAVHSSSPIATVATGRCMVGALLMASHLKDGQELSLYFQGNGPIRTIFAEATFEGQVRAHCGDPRVQGEISPDGIRTGPAIGVGLLTVTHHLPFSNQPHRGTVIIPTGEIGDDLAFYLQQSHQIPSVVALGVHVDIYGRVQAAGGVLIELMPGHTEAEVRLIEERVRSIEPLSKRILDGASPKDLVHDFLADFRLLEMEHDHTVKFQCRCTTERVERSVALLGLGEIDQLIREKKPVDVDCEFCGKKYQIDLSRLAEIRAQVYKSSLN